MEWRFRITRMTLLVNTLGMLGAICVCTYAALGQALVTTANVHALRRWKASQEMTIASVLGQKPMHEAHLPAGLNYMVQSSQGALFASFGTFLSKTDLAVLTSGTPVKMTGLVEPHGESGIFLVREVTVGGRTIMIRNNQGMLVRSHAERPAASFQQIQVAGGAQ